jgi:hypothetical protein
MRKAPAIHVFLVFQHLSEKLSELNFRVDAAGSHQYGGRIPIRLRDVSAGEA